MLLGNQEESKRSRLHGSNFNAETLSLNSRMYSIRTASGIPVAIATLSRNCTRNICFPLSKNSRRSSPRPNVSSGAVTRVHRGTTLCGEYNPEHPFSLEVILTLISSHAEKAVD